MEQTLKQQYGTELIIDASGCDPSVMNRTKLTEFLTTLSRKIDMTLALTPFFWDELNGGATDEPHLKGTSVFQFIETSNIVLHTLTKLEVVFLNVFSCKPFDVQVVEKYTQQFFSARSINSQCINRTYVVHSRETV